MSEEVDRYNHLETRVDGLELSNAEIKEEVGALKGLAISTQSSVKELIEATRSSRAELSKEVKENRRQPMGAGTIASVVAACLLVAGIFGGFVTLSVDPLEANLADVDMQRWEYQQVADHRYEVAMEIVRQNAYSDGSRDAQLSHLDRNFNHLDEIVHILDDRVTENETQIGRREVASKAIGDYLQEHTNRTGEHLE